MKFQLVAAISAVLCALTAAAPRADPKECEGMLSHTAVPKSYNGGTGELRRFADASVCDYPICMPSFNPLHIVQYLFLPSAGKPPYVAAGLVTTKAVVQRTSVDDARIPYGTL